MCGRFACNLDPTVVCRACRYRGKDGAIREPKWLDNPGIPDYKGSPNVAPTNYGAVLVSGKLLTSASDSDQPEVPERVITPMRFGMIPSWHKGDPSSMRLSTINCRREGLLEKTVFATPLKKGRRCVVLCEGFYEWKKMGKSNTKQPYIVYAPEDKLFLQSADDNEKRMEKTPSLLKLAAIFDVWHPKEEGEPDIHSFSIITLDAAPKLHWLHERMPAVLRTEEDVSTWLDWDSVSAEDALKVIHPVEDLAWHPVTRAMGNATYKEPDASSPITPEEAEDPGKPLAKGQTTMTSFFPTTEKKAGASTKKRASSAEVADQPAKTPRGKKSSP